MNAPEARELAAAYREAADEGERFLTVRERLALQRERHPDAYRHAVIGTDGAVVDLDAARARRAR